MATNTANPTLSTTRHRPVGVLLFGAVPLLLVSTTGCITGYARPTTAHGFDDIIPEKYLTEDTKQDVLNFYKARATCSAMEEAALNGQGKAERWRIGVAIGEGVIATTGGVFAGLAGKNAGDAASSAGMSGTSPGAATAAQDAAISARTYTYASLSLAAATALFVVLDNTLGPQSQKGAFTKLASDIFAQKKTADAQKTKFESDMDAKDPNLQTALNELRVGTQILAVCDQLRNSSIDGDSVRSWSTAEYDVFSRVLLASAARGTVTTKIKSMIKSAVDAAAKETDEAKKTALLTQVQDLQSAADFIWADPAKTVQIVRKYDPAFVVPEGLIQQGEKPTKAETTGVKGVPPAELLRQFSPLD